MKNLILDSEQIIQKIQRLSYEIYENNESTTSLLFNHLETKKLIDEIKKVKKTHKIYIFSVGDRDFSNEFKALNGSDFEIKNMPNDFIKTFSK